MNALSPLNLSLIALYGLGSLLSYTLYAVDKTAARRHARRIPERLLHWLAFWGGWPGAWLAQRHFRHKTAKTSFQLVFWLTVLANLAALAALYTLRRS